MTEKDPNSTARGRIDKLSPLNTRQAVCVARQLLYQRVLLSSITSDLFPPNAGAGQSGFSLK